MTSTHAAIPSGRVRPVLLTLVVAFGVVVPVWPVLFPDPRRYDVDPFSAVLTGGPFLAVGCLVLLRAGWHRMGWLLLATGIALAVALAGFPGFPVEYDEWRSDQSWTVVFALFALITLLFPSGRLDSWSGWGATVARLVIWLLLVFILLAALAIPLAFMEGETSYPGAFASLPAALADISFYGASLALLGGMVSLVVRFRRSSGELRAQLAWVVAALAAVALIVVAVVAIILVEGTDENAYLVYTFLVVAYAMVPVAIAVAILRYHLYDIGRIVNRSLVYGSLTAILGLTYAGLVVGLQALLRPFSGGSDLAIVITTLVVAALFLPARRRVQNAVDRRFNRRTYDAARTIDAFAARLREQVDLDTLRYELLTVVDETMQPVRVSLWLREQGTQR